jgi:rubrerythrin
MPQEPSEVRAALRELVEQWRTMAAWEQDEMSNTQSAQAFDQCANELEALAEALSESPASPGTGGWHCEQCGWTIVRTPSPLPPQVQERER